MPEDYRQAFWEDPETGCTTGTTPAGRNPTRKRTGRRKPASRSRRTCGTIPGPSLPPPGGGQRPAGGAFPEETDWTEDPEEPLQNHRYREEKGCLSSPLSPARVQVKRSSPGALPPAQRTKGGQPGPRGGQPPESAGGGRFSSLYSSFCWPGGRRGDHPPDLCAPRRSLPRRPLRVPTPAS